MKQQLVCSCFLKSSVSLLLMFFCSLVGFAASSGSDSPHSSEVVIECDDLDDSGKATAYTTHLFKAVYYDAKPINPIWELELPLADDGVEKIVLADENLTCTLPCIQDDEKYNIDQKGIIEGTVTFSYFDDNMNQHTVSCNINFDLKPYIESAVIDKVEANSPLESSYNLYVRVKYYGAPYVRVSAEEEYSSILKTIELREPYEATGTITHISSRYRVWIDFAAQNKYGETVKTIKLKPGGVIDDSPDDSGVDEILSNQKGDNGVYDKIEVYCVNGIRMMECASMDELEDLKGLYIVRCYREGKLLKTIKFMGS